MKPLFILIPLAATLAGCETRHHIVVEQPKPMEINFNLTGRIEVVITDARKDVEQITGQKPKRKIEAADVLPPEDVIQGSALPTPPIDTDASGVHALACVPSSPMLLLADYRTPSPVAAEDDLKSAMAERNAQVMALLDAKVVGEAHTGLLSPRVDALTADQQKLTSAENSDRQKLYELEAAKKNVPVAKVALSYFLARLEHINKGVWYETYNKDAKAWQWAQMK